MEDVKSKNLKSKFFHHYLVVFVIWLSISHCVKCDDVDRNIDIQSRQQSIQQIQQQTQQPNQQQTQRPIQAQAQQQNQNQHATQRPIGAVHTNGNVNITVNTVKPQTTSSGNIVVELQTPTPAPSNIISIINAKPSETVTNRPISLTSPASNIGNSVSIGTTTRPIQQITARPIQQTTARQIQATTVRPIRATTSRPIQATTVRPNICATVPVGTTARSTTMPVPNWPVDNILAMKTGFSPVPNDPCAYVTCIRTVETLYCATVKCNPGYAFASQANGCLPSLLCRTKPR